MTVEEKEKALVYLVGMLTLQDLARRKLLADTGWSIVLTSSGVLWKKGSFETTAEAAFEIVSLGLDNGGTG